MGQLIFTIDELVNDGWTMTEVDTAIEKSAAAAFNLRDLSIEQQRAFVVWNDYSDKMVLNEKAWDAFLSTDRTGREPAVFTMATYSDVEKYALFQRVRPQGGFLDIPLGRYRRGDKIVISEGDSLVSPKTGKTIQMAPKTIVFTDVYADKVATTVKARYVIEEAVKQLSEKDQAFALATTEERRRISQNNAAAEARKAAKTLGGKALTGTPAQKKWAEDIRRQSLETVSAEVAEKLLSAKKFQTAKWWIDNRGDVKKPTWLTQQVA
jgi:hypothetical protein